MPDRFVKFTDLEGEEHIINTKLIQMVSPHPRTIGVHTIITDQFEDMYTKDGERLFNDLNHA
jgi:hypothetical protein